MVFHAGPDQWLPWPPPTTPEAITNPIIVVKATMATARRIALLRQVWRSSSSILDSSSSSLSLISLLLCHCDNYEKHGNRQCQCSVESVKIKRQVVKHVFALSCS